MKSLNQAERQKAFFKFLLFFVITIAVVITVTLLSAQVPLLDNAQLKANVNKDKQEHLVEVTFAENLHKIIPYLDSLDIQDVSKPIRNRKIEAQISNMTKLLSDNNSLPDSLMYDDILYLINDLKEAKKSLGRLSNDQQTLLEKNQEINRLRNILTQASTVCPDCIQKINGNGK